MFLPLLTNRLAVKPSGERKKKEKKKKKKRNMTRRVEEAEKKVTKLISKQRMNKQWYEVSQYIILVSKLLLRSFWILLDQGLLFRSIIPYNLIKYVTFRRDLL